MKEELGLRAVPGKPKWSARVSEIRIALLRISFRLLNIFRQNSLEEL